MAAWGTTRRDGTELAWRDFGGVGAPVLLLHGLAGHGGEWSPTARWLTRRARVIAPDTRGHGRSERRPEDVSPAAVVADAACLLDHLGLAPAAVVGQSLGGLTALSLAAEHPQLVRGLVLIEASPEGTDDHAEARTLADGVGTSLSAWPVPFASAEQASAYFTERFGSAAVGAAWTLGLEDREDGLWPRWDADVLVRMLSAAITGSRWEQWRSLSVPALILRGERGDLSGATVAQMLARLPGARAAEIGGAGHDLHLEAPRGWELALSGFLDDLEP